MCTKYKGWLFVNSPKIKSEKICHNFIYTNTSRSTYMYKLLKFSSKLVSEEREKYVFQFYN